MAGNDADSDVNVKSRARTLALAGIIGPVWFAILVIVQGFLLPDYSHIQMPISALAAWPTGWIQVLNFCVFGSLIVAFAFGLHMGVQPIRGGALGISLLIASGIGIIAAGVFSWKMVDGVPTATPAHVVAAIPSFAATGLGLMAFSRRMRADVQWRDLSTYTMMTGIAVFVLFVTLGLFGVDDGAPLHPWAGLVQRILCAIWFACLIVLARRLRGRCKSTAAGTTS
jgi:Protein of unknown function (DUF998)